MNTVLDDVVDGAGLDVFRGRLFVQRPGHDDHRGQRALPVNHSERVQSVEPRQGMIGKDDGGPKVPQGASQLRFGLHAHG